MMETFCGISGQKISYAKSNIIFLTNTVPKTRKELSHATKIKESKQLSNLTTWRTKHLSMEGRVTLVKYVTYSMICSRMPR